MEWLYVLQSYTEQFKLPGFLLTGFLPMRGLRIPSSLQTRCCRRGGEGRRHDMLHVEWVTNAVFACVNKLILGCDVEIYKISKTLIKLLKTRIFLFL